MLIHGASRHIFYRTGHHPDVAAAKQPSPQPEAQTSGPATEPLYTAPITPRARLDARSLTLHDVLQLQRMVGHQAVSWLLRATIQRRPLQEEWEPTHKTKRTRPGALPYEEYKKRTGQPGKAEKFAPEMKAASEWGGTNG
jgi:hypothetical protein